MLNDYRVQSACWREDERAMLPATMHATFWYVNGSAEMAGAGCWSISLLDAPEGRGLVVMLKHNRSEGGLTISAANPHATGGGLTLKVSGLWHGEACSPGPSSNSSSSNMSVVHMALPSETGLAGQTVAAYCAPYPMKL